MKHGPIPLSREVVLIGGGHTHALFLRKWGMNPVAGARLTIINPAPSAPYTGMLPGHIAGHYSRDELEIDLVRLARFAGARIIFGMVDAIDLGAHRVHVAGRRPLAYHIASIDIGITSDMPEIAGFSEHAVAAKPLGPYARKWRDFLAGDEAGPVTVIGGGVAGVELALAMHHALKSAGKPADVTVLEAEKLLSGVGVATRGKLIAEMKSADIAYREGVRVQSVTETDVHLSDGTIPSRFTVGAAGARPFGWLAETGLELTDGYISVDATLRTSEPSLYATGDCAHLSHAPRPKAGVFAVRAAPVLAHNIAADLTGGARKRFYPQRHYLKLISLGGKSALAEKWNRSIGGDWAWTWKDRIDRKFMDRLNNPPKMEAPALPGNTAKGVIEALGDKPLCGGCGAKVGSSALDQVIDRLPKVDRPDIATATGDDAAVLKIGDRFQALSTDHLRAFWDDPALMARISAVHALGDVWAMGAKPQAALAQIILPRMSEEMQAVWLDEIMAAASDVFTASGAAIVGGHTSLGAELTIGFTVTGLQTERPIAQSGARAGDALVLTRPIGSGTILAADMALCARGRDVAACLAVMATPQGDAADLLAPHARAMTDVTGFGLAGHLARMAGASGLSAEINLDAVPLYAGAEALAADGIRSSLFEANRAISADVPDTPAGTLMFDPQTAGGLLAAIPEASVESILKALRHRGHIAAMIGRMGPKSGIRVKVR